MTKFKVYVDEFGDLCTQVGEVVRKATPQEIEDAEQTTEGYIECPDDVAHRLCVDESDGTTRIKI